MNRLDVKAFGLSLGIVWGGLSFVLGIVDMLYFWGSTWGRMMTMVYIGYRPTVFGSIIGGVWGFLYASILGFVVARLYNNLVEENKLQTEERIKELAKRIWEKKGKPQGTAQEDWRQAEREIRGE